MASAGVPVAALVAAFRRELGPDGAWLHWGATSQDVVDTALVLRLRGVLDILDGRLARLIAALGGAGASGTAATVIAARTRFQIATPTTLGAKIAVWTMPLVRHRQRLAELRPRLLRVSLAGASGTNAALAGAGGRGDARRWPPRSGSRRRRCPGTRRATAMAELGGWLALVTGSLGKIGQDLILLGQSEVGEVTAGAGGGSSTMPHKANPVGRRGAGDAGAAQRRQRSASCTRRCCTPRSATARRSGSSGSRCPAMCAAAGAATRHALALAETLAAHPERIAATFAADRGLMLAEAAVFALAERMPRPEAQALVARGGEGGRRGAGEPRRGAGRPRSRARLDGDPRPGPADRRRRGAGRRARAAVG